MGGINAIETESITGGVSVFLVASLNKTPGPPFTHFLLETLSDLSFVVSIKIKISLSCVTSCPPAVLHHEIKNIE